MKTIKKKENIREQILLKIKHYENSRGITLFDKSDNLAEKNLNLENNELEVVLIKFNKKEKILLTTKNIYYFDKNNFRKIAGENIDRFDYLEFINGEKIMEEKSRIKIFFLRMKMRFRIGTYRIVEKNDSFIELKIWKTNYADCLNNGIKRLKFIGTKYEAI
ncbi:hypothetical protein [Tenacibaculum geojense]|uniref:Uncharacterized protein n=1 Tax=Tenacibaculum geojense TaxID=915352 RepID=A0ABW3JMT9_9FLAO